jgi:hypothetical protein
MRPIQPDAHAAEPNPRRETIVLRRKIAMLAAISAAGLALGGFAAPASASGVGTQALIGTAWTNDAGTTGATSLDDNQLNTCRPIASPVYIAESAENTSSNRTITFYLTEADCTAGAFPVATLSPGSGVVDIEPFATYYKVS